MPAKDKYHDTVVIALEKAGWTIADEQILLAIDNRHLWVDIQASKEDEARVILVEVKGFEAIPSAFLGKFIKRCRQSDHRQDLVHRTQQSVN